MKKLFTVLALTLMAAIMAVTVAGCGTDTSAVDNLTNKVDELTERIEDLEKKNNDLTSQLKKLNVFWTDKKEYSETETMTIYFGQTATFRIRLKNFAWVNTSGSNPRFTINCDFYLTSLCSDILEDSIATATYLIWDNGTYMRDSYLSDNIAKQGIEKVVGRSYQGDGTASAYNNATYFDFVVCVPGTPFELARFKNVTVNK